MKILNIVIAENEQDNLYLRDVLGLPRFTLGKIAGKDYTVRGLQILGYYTCTDEELRIIKQRINHVPATDATATVAADGNTSNTGNCTF